jgi:RNA polymerase sigma factor (TIGR02999 family)
LAQQEDEFRKLAARQLAREKPGQTLQATAVVHDAYLRLVEGQGPGDWEGRGHFFAAAAEAMRRILVDAARRKRRPKHGGDRRRVDADEAGEAIAPPARTCSRSTTPWRSSPPRIKARATW